MTVMEQTRLKDHLYMYWLRPEAALWDAIAAREIGAKLQGCGNILEVGIGNGFFSYLLLGGSFTEEFDWFYSVETSGFRDNEDIFDHDSGVDVGKYLCTRPVQRLKFAVDHKQTLLNQAASLGLADELIKVDANQAMKLNGVDTIYSNILYWLNDPIAVLRQWQDILPVGGKVVIAFPNERFYRVCRSYTDTSRLWKLLNRGRASSIMWHMDIPEFEKKLLESTQYKIVSSKTYLSDLTLRIWDVGLRPLSPALIKMANSVDAATRLEIKHEWCSLMMPYLEEMLQRDMDSDPGEGGFNLVVLEKVG